MASNLIKEVLFISAVLLKQKLVLFLWLQLHTKVCLIKAFLRTAQILLDHVQYYQLQTKKKKLYKNIKYIKSSTLYSGYPTFFKMTV